MLNMAFVERENLTLLQGMAALARRRWATVQIAPFLMVGANGYVLKRSVAEVLSQTIHAMAAGGVYLDPALKDNVDGLRLGHAQGREVDTSDTLNGGGYE